MEPYGDVNGSCRTMKDKEIPDLKNGKKMINQESYSMKSLRTLAVVEGEGGDINERAEAFIKNFRNHLKIQRDESFKRFKEMIARGT